ncbi:MAG TPA: fatty acid desaturase, partial [Longimicrobiales bacterium]
CLVALVAVMWTTIGIGAFLAVQIPVTLITCAAGVWLFYVQHQFEETYWYGHQEWDFVEASLYGSSHLVLPRPLQWLTAWIGIHHVHHLNSLIPNYRLEACLDANPELQVARKVTLKDGWDLLWLTLWDERSERLIRFSELKSLATA